MSLMFIVLHPLIVFGSPFVSVKQGTGKRDGNGFLSLFAK